MREYIDTDDLFQDLEERRELLSLSINEFCEMLHMSKSTYYRWKRGISPAQIDLCLTLINFLQVEITDE